MNQWIEKSIKLANTPGYLDKLSQVYPVNINLFRPLPKNVKKKLNKLFNNDKKIELVEELINRSKFPKFPIKDPYVAYFRNHPQSIKNNPHTLDRICKMLFDIGFEKMIEGLEEPKEFNRQIGSLFKKYPKNMGFPYVEEKEFQKNSKGIFVLKGTDSSLKEFAKKNMGYKIDKGLDVIAKVNTKYVIGEAKFLTDFGGHQNAQFNDALSLINKYDGQAIPIAILDGVVWIHGTNKMHKTLLEQKNTVLSALLIPEFLESLRQ